MLLAPTAARRRGADRLDGQRPRARRALRPPAAAVLLLQAAVRAGHQPADRPDPRVDRDERRHRRRLRAQPARRDARARAPARRWSSRSCATHELEKLRQVDSIVFDAAHARHHVAGRRRARRARERALERVCAEAVGVDRTTASTSSSSPTATSAPSASPIPSLLAVARRPPPPRARGHAPAGRPRARVRRAARGPPLRDADRLRRVGDQPVRDVRVARRAGRGRRGCPDGMDVDEAEDRVVKGIGKGLLKTISKMGISTIQSYTARRSSRPSASPPS